MRGSVNRRLFAAGSAATLVIGLGIAAVPAAGAAPAVPAAGLSDSYSISLSQQTITSSTHQNINLSVYANDSSFGGTESNSVTVTVNKKGSTEDHSFNFGLSNGSLGYNPKTGKGGIKTGKQLGSFGLVNLTMADDGKAHVTKCGGFQLIDQPVSVKGAVSLNTKSKGKGAWGTVGSAKSRTFSKGGTVSYSKGTPQPCGHFPSICGVGEQWYANDRSDPSEPTSFSGTMQGKDNSIYVSSRVSFSKPSGASRLDSESGRNKKMKFSVKAGKATIKIGASGVFSGSATLQSAGSAGHRTITCGKKSLAEDNWGSTTYTNGKKPLSVKTIYGPLKVANRSLTDAAGGDCYIIRES